MEQNSPHIESILTNGAQKNPFPYRAVFGFVILAIAIALVSQLGVHLLRFAAWVESLQFLGPVAFIAGYILATVMFIPGAILTLTGGAIFGIAKGTLYSFLGATLGSVTAFLISRYVVRSAVKRWLVNKPRFALIDQAVGFAGRKIVLLMRLSPIFPFNLLNYGLGLTSIGLTDYVIASIGMLPGTLLYAYYGRLAGDVAALAGGATVERGLAYYGVLLLGLAATVTVTTIVSRIARRTLKNVLAQKTLQSTLSRPLHTRTKESKND